MPWGYYQAESSYELHTVEESEKASFQNRDRDDNVQRQVLFLPDNAWHIAKSSTELAHGSVLGAMCCTEEKQYGAARCAVLS